MYAQDVQVTEVWREGRVMRREGTGPLRCPCARVGNVGEEAGYRGEI